LQHNTKRLWYLRLWDVSNTLSAMPPDVDAIYLAIGSRVRDIRLASRITQAAIAAEAGLSRQSVANIEKGRQRFMVHTLLDIARALSVDPVSLLPTDKTSAISDDVDQFGLSAKAKRFVLSVLESKGRR
jgi:transcriptional regulator with XRE-family HTH domain